MKEEGQTETVAAVQRLCSEIQLFDLCDLDVCRYKSSRFCTNDELIAKFEAIKEEDDRNSLLYEETEDEEDVDSDSDFDEFDDSFEDDDE